MGINISIHKEDPRSSDALILVEELSSVLEVLTGSSGKASFYIEDVIGDGGVFVIARNELGEAVGCGAIRPLDRDIAEIKRMYARKSRMGIGSKILSYLENESSKLGYSALRLETRVLNQNALEFYRKNGYHVISNYGRYVNRPEAICFEKQLTAKESGNEILTDLIKGFNFANEIQKDYFNFFLYHNKPEIAEHCKKVSQIACNLADRFGICREAVEMAGFLHDISRVIPDQLFVNMALKQGININEQEQLLPSLLHQKLSKEIAKNIFHIKDDSILNAIACHTTLRANANKTDLILFIADKLSWENIDNMPIVERMNQGLKISLEHSAFQYLKYLWDHRSNGTVMHPWAIEAYEELKAKCDQVFQYRGELL